MYGFVNNTIQSSNMVQIIGTGSRQWNIKAAGNEEFQQTIHQMPQQNQPNASNPSTNHPNSNIVKLIQVAKKIEAAR